MFFVHMMAIAAVCQDDLFRSRIVFPDLKIHFFVLEIRRIEQPLQAKP